MLDQLPLLVWEYKNEKLPEALLRIEKEKNTPFRLYFAYSSLSHRHRFLAVGDYVVNKKPVLFVEHLKKAMNAMKMCWQLRIKVQMFNPTMHYIDVVMDSLALGQWDISVELMQLVEHATKEGSHKFIINLFRCVKAFLYEEKELENYIDQAITFWTKDTKSFVGFGYGFKAIYHKDAQAFEDALQQVVKGHKKLVRPGSIFTGVDAVIPIWGVGLVNLARMKGLDFTFDHPTIPAELII